MFLNHKPSTQLYNGPSYLCNLGVKETEYLKNINNNKDLKDIYDNKDLVFKFLTVCEWNIQILTPLCMEK